MYFFACPTVPLNALDALSRGKDLATSSRCKGNGAPYVKDVEMVFVNVISNSVHCTSCMHMHMHIHNDKV